jgi:hypothetical protein
MRILGTFAVLLCIATQAHAAPSPEAKCRAAKTRAAGAYAACLQNGAGKLALTGDTAKYETAVAKCANAVAASFAKAEAAATRKGAECPTTGDGTAIAETIATDAETVSGALAPGGALPACGDSTINAPGEECDTVDLGARTCALLGFASGDLACDASCHFDASLCSLGCDQVGGVADGPVCWVIGHDQELSCDDVCAAKHMTCNEAATRDFAGSGGAQANCVALAAELTPGTFSDHDEEDFSSCGTPAGQGLGVGCGIFNWDLPASTSVRVIAPPTTCADPGYNAGCGTPIRRICACE